VNKIIAISGSSGVGKTTISRLISIALPNEKTLVFSGDDLHKWERGDNKWQTYTHLNPEANNLLLETDWYVTRKSEKSTAIPSNITTWRNGIRSKQAAMETSITNANDTPALETLYTYVNTADEGDPVVMERPIGEFPELGS